MPYDVVAIGGTGQWFLLQLALHRIQRKDVELPGNLWIADADFNLSSGGLAMTVDAGYNQAAGWVTSRAKRIEFNQRWCRPALPRSGAREIRTSFGPEILQEITHASVGERERATAVDRGFHALPRLAAVWASMHGFEGSDMTDVGGIGLPQCFSDQSLGARTDDPLVLVGSLAGGTGAGLLPYLFRQARRPPVQGWLRPVVVLAVLPWFNPEGGNSPDVSVTWSDNCRNASFGVHALFRVVRTLSEEAKEAPGIAWTRCVFAGPDPHTAAAQPPLDPRVCQEGELVAPVLRALVEALPDLVKAPAAETKRIPFTIGTIQIKSTQLRRHRDGQHPGADEPVALEIPIERVANVYAGLQAGELSRMPFTAAASTLGGIQRVSGLGRVLRDLVLTVSLAPRASQQRFFERFSEQLRRRQETLESGPQVEFSETAATEQQWIIEDLDKAMLDAELRELIRTADCAKSDATAVAQRAVSAADLIAGVLRRRASEFFGEDPEQAAQRLRDVSVITRRLLPSNDRRVSEASSYPGFCPFDGLDQAEEELLAGVYAEAGGLGAGFQSRSYATHLSAAHVLEGLAERLRPGEHALDTPKLADVLLLWRAALNGLLTRVAVTGPRTAQIGRTESLDSDFPGLAALLFDNRVVGFTSVDVGFVPHVDWLEDDEAITVNPDMTRLKDSLVQRLDGDPTLDVQVLYAFAHELLSQAGVDRARSDDVPAWAKVLLAASPVDDCAGVLDRHAVDGLTLRLRRSRGPRHIKAFVPLRVDARQLRRVIAAAEDEKLKAFLPQQEAQGRWTLSFDPFGRRPEYICTFERDGADRVFLSVDHAHLQRAARAVPA